MVHSNLVSLKLCFSLFNMAKFSIIPFEIEIDDFIENVELVLKVERCSMNQDFNDEN